jgi:hypothetical protein
VFLFKKKVNNGAFTRCLIFGVSCGRGIVSFSPLLCLELAEQALYAFMGVISYL